MKRDKWTQQLHNKLAEYETAAPDDLWADIEARLDQQPKPVPSSSRFVAMRRWAVAASIVLLIAAGGYLWRTTSEQSQQTAQTFPDSQGEGSLAQLHAPQGEGAGVGSETSPDRSQKNLSEGIIQTPPLTPRLEGRGVAAREEPQMTEEPQPQIAEEPQPHMTEKAQRQFAELPRRQTTEPSVVKTKRQVSLGLYAMNGLGNQNSSNGVLMADALAKQYMETYAYSNVAATRRSEPIWLAGYEERQHHHRPITYGLTLSYPLSDRISLTTGVVYTKLQSDFTQVMRSQQIQQEQTLHYVGIPLNLNYKLWAYKRFRTYLSAGVKADWNVATHLETEGVSQQLAKDRMQWSLNASLGLQYDIVPQLGLYVEPGLNWYPDNGSKLQNYFKDKPLSCGLQLGLRMSFN